MTRRLLAAVAATALLVAGCAQGKAGTPIPDGDEAAGYVSAKFTDTLEKLHDDFQGMPPRKATLDKTFLINGEGVSTQISTVQIGSPPAELVRNHAKDNLNDSIDYLHPAGEKITYALLGPMYTSLAPTPWVSMPAEFATGELGACATGTYIAACKMVNAMVNATKNYKAAKVAKRLADGSVELEVDITFRTFLEFKIEQFPDELIAKFTDEMMNNLVKTKISLTPQMKARQIEMTSKFNGKSKIDKDVQIDVHYLFQIIEGATEKDIPAIPDAAQVTALPDQAAVDDFNRRKGEAQGR
ncbi:hypothetical protein [Amycolatopsis sp. YIM 10]|uniref:hypothetical protein n=1 Tax=Amycolatopsis sp. YIM 10 TaxID=2653857 RepID=UPI0012904A94|nr:hypothetical protein [Amycolatopsis sp. YIM 10]QFU93937.1 hypothetical protein YIM_44015 [Amycolatopsis sp. YIM 10]